MTGTSAAGGDRRRPSRMTVRVYGMLPDRTRVDLRPRVEVLAGDLDAEFLACDPAAYPPCGCAPCTAVGQPAAPYVRADAIGRDRRAV